MIRILCICCLIITCVCSCKSPKARTPEKTTSGSFIEASVQRNKQIYKQEKAIIQELINKDSLRDYISSERGFWYAITKKDSTASLQKPTLGDLISFTYNVKDLKGNLILSTKENGIQNYKVDQSNQDLISGIRDGIKLLNVGEQATFIFPSYKAYGYYGIEKILGTNIPITSDITLISINQNQ
ncbi:MAG: gliding motility-associated peptidyl-prolyl isomerase [Candidatus Paceibacteria bacterium]|jgi:gliding motility-associated peptidyl-prolyl isomerase